MDKLNLKHFNMQKILATSQWPQGGQFVKKF